MDNRDCVIGIFLDFSKAFDTVDHNIILQKIRLYGIEGITLQWFQDYLYKRTQYVTYNTIKSCHKNVKCGVPQG